MCLPTSTDAVTQQLLTVRESTIISGAVRAWHITDRSESRGRSFYACGGPIPLGKFWAIAFPRCERFGQQKSFASAPAGC